MDPTTLKLMQGAAGAVSATYIEDVFSTWLYTGNGSTQTITNGIDLSGKGGLVWIKGRSGTTGHRFTDTARGATKSLESNSTAAEATESTGLTSFSSTGFALGADTDYNTNAATYASWTFRKAAKFFDVVTYTGNGTNNDIAHSLGVAPGFILIKRTDSISDWFAYPRYDDSGNATFPYLYKDLKLNTTDASAGNLGSLASSTILRANSTGGNINGATYVAYLFAHDAGGFGDSGNDNVVSCGSFTEPASGSTTVTLGWEPQFVLIKPSNAVAGWYIFDNMRTLNYSNNFWLQANASSAESTSTPAYISPTSTGFTFNAGFIGSGTNYIYIAIRRGPMKTPTDATKVFSTFARSGTGAAATITTPAFPVDFILGQERTAIGLNGGIAVDRLRGAAAYLRTPVTTAEGSNTTVVSALDSMTGFSLGASDALNGSSSTYANWVFRRAPGFFDAVCYTGTGSARTVTHNLGVAPELMIVKKRSAADAWVVYANNDNTDYLVLNTTAATVDDNTIWNDTSPTSSVFTVGTNDDVNGNTATFVAYLFASCPGVSKCFSFTGTGTTKQIDCGFTNGARFVMIKRTDSTGDWYVWDSARGIISGNDPYLLLNSTAAEVTNTDYIDPYSAGFEISSTAPAAINANGGSYIGLAIA